jgi:hypothetical protein
LNLFSGLQARHCSRDGRLRRGEEEQKVCEDSRIDSPHRKHHEHRNEERAVRRVRHQLPAKSKSKL